MRRPWEPPSGSEILVANAAAAGLYLAGGALTATWPLLPNVSSGGWVTFVGVSAATTASALLLIVRAGHGTLSLAWAADLWGVALIIVLCAASGGASSPFAVLYLFAIGHGAAFQSLGRLIVVVGASVAGFIAPLAYESITSEFAAIACIGIVLATLTAGVVHIALNDIRYQRRLMRVMIAATATLTASLDPLQTMRAFASEIVPKLADVCWVDLLEAERPVIESLAVAADPAVAVELEQIARDAPLSLASTHPAAQVLRDGRPYETIVAHDADYEAIGRSDAHRDLIRRFGGEAVAIFPLLARGRTRGAISFMRFGSDRRFAPDVLELLADLSGRAALAFDNAHLYAERTKVAHTLRRSLMPSVLPEIPGLDLVSFFRPLGAGSEVGGDFYDAFGASGSWWLIVGDVCGKGAEAAALTGFLRHTTAAITREAIRPATVLSRVNELMLAQDFGGRFATAALVRVKKLDTHAEITLASAGHPPALVTRVDGRVEELGERGTLLGVFPDPIIAESSAVLEIGDALALYTDGLLEAHAPEDIVTPEELVGRVEGLRSPRSARETLDALLGVVNLDDDVRDDIVVLVGQITQRGSTDGALAEDGARGGLRLHD